MYNDNGDMVTEEGQVFRQVGWQINGGEWDGTFVNLGNEEELRSRLLDGPHGGYSPIYVEVGRD